MRVTCTNSKHFERVSCIAKLFQFIEIVVQQKYNVSDSRTKRKVNKKAETLRECEKRVYHLIFELKYDVQTQRKDTKNLDPTEYDLPSSMKDITFKNTREKILFFIF